MLDFQRQFCLADLVNMGPLGRRTFLMGLPGLLGCSGSGFPRLNVYNWSNYVGLETISRFEAEFRVRVRYSAYESNEEMLAKVLTGNSGWDVVFPSNYLILPMRENGLLEPLRSEWLPNLPNLDEPFQHPAWDKNLQWCVPYMWGGSGIVYNRRLNPLPAAWSDLWQPGLSRRITMLDDPAEVLGACLKKIGHSVNSVEPALLEAAKREAVSQKPLLRAYLNAEVGDQLVSGDVLAAQLWATTAGQAIAETQNLAFVYPQEGFPLYADNAVVLRESSRPRLAHEFINYLLRPAVAGEVVLETHTATANGSAKRRLPPTVRDNPVLYPPPDILERGEWFEPIPATAQRLRDRIWTEIKAA